MKITLDNIACFYSGKGQSRSIIREILGVCRGLILIILVIALVACNRPQQASSGGGDNVVTSTPATPAPLKDAGGAVLNLERNRSYDDQNGSDIQREVGTIPLVFSFSNEGPLIVEGTGKLEWTEQANYSYCGFTAKADGTVLVTGLFHFEDCKFDLGITTKYSQPTTSNQAADCTYSLVFSETEFYSQIELYPFSGGFKESMTDGWWTVSTVKLSDLKSDAVQNCEVGELIFTPEVISLSTQTP